ncbi:MAG: haloacid dehalogenase-like hydrolase [Tenericutes bacterium]|nr:haloacid dehalogenase-like hydrolase [Mycoplasmatota bacterium]
MKLAIYDFDGTYMSSQGLKLVFRFWKKQNLNMSLYHKIWTKIWTRYFFQKFHLFGWTKQNFRANAMALTADLFRSVDKAVLDTFLEDLYEHLRSYINPQIKQELLKDIEAGYYTILLSGNFDIILKPFLKEGFDEVIGSPAIRDGEVLPSEEIKIIIHDGKAKIILDKFSKADFLNSKAYADSNYDLPILEIVGNPVAVNPDKMLKKIALERNYRIIELEDNE